MLIRTEGYTKYSQGQRIGVEIIHPRDLDKLLNLKRYAELSRNEVIELEDKKPLG